jgi:hypothetical protein
MGKILYWLPRVFAIAFILFISMFALDVFGETQWLLALLIHLIPSFVLILLTLVAWKNKIIGAALFIIAGVVFLVSSDFESLIISIPMIVIGLLFVVSWKISNPGQKS